MKGVKSGFKESKMSFGSLENEDGETSLTVDYKSAFSVPVKIKKLELAFSDGDLLQMEQDEVEIQPQENVPIVLSGQVSGVSKSELENAEVSAEFEIGGATIAFAGGAQGG